MIFLKYFGNLVNLLCCKEMPVFRLSHTLSVCTLPTIGFNQNHSSLLHHMIVQLQWQAISLGHKYQTRVKLNVSDNHSRLLHHSIVQLQSLAPSLGHTYNKTRVKLNVKTTLAQYITELYQFNGSLLALATNIRLR